MLLLLLLGGRLGSFLVLPDYEWEGFLAAFIVIIIIAGAHSI